MFLPLIAISCATEEPTQRLIAVGQLLDADGTPRANAPIERYQLTFVLDGEVEIERTFRHDAIGAQGIVTDEQGMFRITDDDLALSYDWQQDEYVCQDVCVEVVTECYEVEEDVCVEQCDVVTYEDCYDECYEDCTTTCYDELVCTTYTDDEGNEWEECYTETVCEDDCTSTCEPVCGTVTEEQCWDDCHVEVYEQCDDHCVATEEHCDWVTRTYTSYPELSEVIDTRATITVLDADGAEQTIEGDPLDGREDQECTESDDGPPSCKRLGVWLQRDRFMR